MKKNILLLCVLYLSIGQNVLAKNRVSNEYTSPQSKNSSITNQYLWTDKINYNITASLSIPVTATAGVKGVKIALGKNPPGGRKYLSTVTNDDGNIEFEIKEIGNYQFNIDYSKETAIEIEKKFGIGRNSFEGFKVKISNSANKKVISSNITNEKGEFELSNLNVGNYTLTIFYELLEGGGITIPDSPQSTRGGMVASWGRHGFESDCQPTGIFCRQWLRIRNLTGFKLEENSSLGESKVTIEENLITVTTIGTKSTLSEEMIQDFQKKEIKPLPLDLPEQMLKDILSQVGLKMPKGKVSIKPTDQKFMLNETENRGKKVSIMEVYEKASLNIDGKTYTLLLITTSSRGAGSPKHAGF